MKSVEDLIMDVIRLRNNVKQLFGDRFDGALCHLQNELMDKQCEIELEAYLQEDGDGKRPSV
jgi:hypothetical protein